MIVDEKEEYQVKLDKLTIDDPLLIVCIPPVAIYNALREGYEVDVLVEDLPFTGSFEALCFTSVLAEPTTKHILITI